MSLQKNLSNNIKFLYSRDHKTITAFADELDICRSSLQEILKGTSNPRLDTVEHIAKHLDIDPMALLLPNFAEEYIQVVMPLLQIYNIAAALTDDERLELAKHLHAITDILLKTDSK